MSDHLFRPRTSEPPDDQPPEFCFKLVVRHRIAGMAQRYILLFRIGLPFPRPHRDTSRPRGGLSIHEVGFTHDPNFFHQFMQRWIL